MSAVMEALALTQVLAVLGPLWARLRAPPLVQLLLAAASGLVLAPLSVLVPAVVAVVAPVLLLVLGVAAPWTPSLARLLKAPLQQWSQALLVAASGLVSVLQSAVVNAPAQVLVLVLVPGMAAPPWSPPWATLKAPLSEVQSTAASGLILALDPVVPTVAEALAFVLLRAVAASPKVPWVSLWAQLLEALWGAPEAASALALASVLVPPLQVVEALLLALVPVFVLELAVAEANALAVLFLLLGVAAPPYVLL